MERSEKLDVCVNCHTHQVMHRGARSLCCGWDGEFRAGLFRLVDEMRWPVKIDGGS